MRDRWFYKTQAVALYPAVSFFTVMSTGIVKPRSHQAVSRQGEEAPDGGDVVVITSPSQCECYTGGALFQNGHRPPGLFYSLGHFCT